MSDDLLPFEAGAQAGVDRRPNRGLLPSPSVLTNAGQIDRRNEANHAVAIREIYREVERAHYEVAKELAHDFDLIDADARRLTEQKFRLQRAAKESQILGADDPELSAKFRVLDDEMFVRYREMGLGGGR